MGNESVVEVRRARLRQVIRERYKNIQANMVRDIGINAGELSGLLKTRFFGEKKARLLEQQLGLPDQWMDGATQTPVNQIVNDVKLILEHGNEDHISLLVSMVDLLKGRADKERRG